MFALSVLLMISGVFVTTAFGTIGYVLGPLAVLGGALLFYRERRRRREYGAKGEPLPRRSGGIRFLIGLASTFVAIIGLFALVWRATAGLVDTADRFFMALKAGDMNAARTHLAEEFRASTSDAQLRRFVEYSALSNYESASWTTRSIQNSRGVLEGTVNTASGGAIPMSIALVRENGAWKILALRKADAGILGDDSRPQPNHADQVRLVRAATAEFSTAVASRDFTRFRAASAALWQKQVTVQQLNDAFKGFSDAGIDLRGIEAQEPAITEARYDDGGAFAISGAYPLGENTFTFRYRYIFEATDWKIVGLHANVR